MTTAVPVNQKGFLLSLRWASRNRTVCALRNAQRFTVQDGRDFAAGSAGAGAAYIIAPAATCVTPAAAAAAARASAAGWSAVSRQQHAD